MLKPILIAAAALASIASPATAQYYSSYGYQAYANPNYSYSQPYAYPTYPGQILTQGYAYQPYGYQTYPYQAYGYQTAPSPYANGPYSTYYGSREYSNSGPYGYSDDYYSQQRSPYYYDQRFQRMDDRDDDDRDDTNDD